MKRVCELLAAYLVELVTGARGNVVSFVVGDVSKWAEFRMRLTKSIVFRVAHMTEALLAAGYLDKMGKKYILRRNTSLWEMAKSRDIEGICRLVENVIVQSRA